MAVTQNTYTGNGSNVLFSFTFPYIDESDIKVEVNNSLITAYTLANATTIQFNTAPANGALIRIYRATDDAQLKAEFFPGSAVRAQDLNENFNQSLYISQEARNNSLDPNNPVFLDDVNFNNYKGINVAAPTANTDAANKAYVDGLIQTGAANATAAANSASAAAASAASAANVYDSFDDRYLGSKNSDPATDNDGNSLIIGALYFNIGYQSIRIWDGNGWKSITASQGITRWRKAASAGQITLSGLDDSNRPLVYSAGNELVYLNGLLLTRDQNYTANNGNTVTMLSPLGQGNIVEIISQSESTIDAYQYDGGSASSVFGGTLNYFNGGNA